MSKLNGERGFVFNPHCLTLTGTVNGYSVVILDASSEFVIAVFAEEPIKKMALDFLPKNALGSLKTENDCVIIKLSGYIMSQKNLPLLLKTAEIAANTQFGTPLPISVSVIENNSKDKAPPKTETSNPRIIITALACITALALILFLPMTVVQRALLALIAGGIAYFGLVTKNLSQ
ncbi:MAG: hypothetical protein FWH07_05250 [Oscillospiraceae bacterium]|nr:hypothetical protein [Oscillospiraceae bacterium]